jgi:hypothetical protein
MAEAAKIAEVRARRADASADSYPVAPGAIAPVIAVPPVISVVIMVNTVVVIVVAPPMAPVAGVEMMEASVKASAMPTGFRRRGGEGGDQAQGRQSA